MSIDKITVRGARQHNLKNINVEIPRNQLTVITGLSGSGKSSLAFDTIYAEGQRRYVESLSAYARQFLDQLEKPDVDSVEGLSPAISIEQKTVSKSPRSTVGTVTEIYDYLRLLFSSIGQPHCHQCGLPITRQSVEQIITGILAMPEGERVMILAPIVRGRKGEFKKELDKLNKDGFVRARIDDELRPLDEEIILDKRKNHTIEVVVDRLLIKDGVKERLTEAVKVALKLTGGAVLVAVVDGDEKLYSEKMACVNCGINIATLEPRSFSFNSNFGACKTCHGIGAIAKIKEKLKKKGKTEEMEEVVEYIVCGKCEGKRLQPESLAVRINGLGIADYTGLTIEESVGKFEHISLSDRENKVAGLVLREIKNRLNFLNKVGLGYLTLDRPSASLSGGEGQRIRLATQIGSQLRGVLYVLDEPSIGLHPRDNLKLIETMQHLRDIGNTVLVVEHDEETIRMADFVIDLGVGAGTHGGEVVAIGLPQDIENNQDSVTGKYLRGDLRIEIPKIRRSPNGKNLIVKGARAHNLKNVDVTFPLGLLTVVTGVSGSGKSTLVADILYRALSQKVYRSNTEPLEHDSLEGAENIDKVIEIDQTPIGRTPRSNPATYTGLFTPLRELFTMLPESRTRGYKAGRFSFNVKGGRCEACEGDGMKRIEMNFLPDVYVLCDVCRGARYNRETLSVKYKGKSISDLLNTTIEDAIPILENIPAIKQKLQTLLDVGLGYIKIGQSSTTLSGGEAQRIKLAKELSKRQTGKTIYILDEPTTGLHFADVHKLLDVLQRLVELGNTVIVIEHNLDVIKTADYVIDLGPEGGAHGGKIVAVGTPEEIAKNKKSHTGKALRTLLS